MSLSTSRLAYQDCYDLMDQALADLAGIRLEFEDHNTAIYFRMRLHQARKIDRVDNLDVYDVGHYMHGKSQYDILTMRIHREEETFWLYLEHSKTRGLQKVEKLSPAVPKLARRV